MIDPTSVAFDIDGVVADTMTLFLDIARNEFDLHHIRYEDITCYTLEECLDIPTDILYQLIERLLDGNYGETLAPLPHADQVLNRLALYHSPLLFVTARPYPGPITDWLSNILPHLKDEQVEVVTTGSFDAKADVLNQKKRTVFVEDRLETCYVLQRSGITPILFKQPWNREAHPFTEVGSWKELEALMTY
jgi:5'(3')-deoxyribonucleotidase